MPIGDLVRSLIGQPPWLNGGIIAASQGWFSRRAPHASNSAASGLSPNPLGGAAQAAEGKEMQAVDRQVCVLFGDQRVDQFVGAGLDQDAGKGGVASAEGVQRGADAAADRKFGECRDARRS